MFRPKSAAGSTRSFLDDLLGNNDSADGSPASRQRKSVRFFDQDDDDTGSQQQQQRPATARPHSSTLDSLLNPGSSSTPTTANRPSTAAGPSAARSKSADNWLGLGDDDDESDSTLTTNLLRKAAQASSQSSSNVTLSKLQDQIGPGPLSSVTTTASSEPDWLTSGLKARAAAASAASTAAPTQPQQQPQQLWQPKLVNQTPQPAIPTNVPAAATTTRVLDQSSKVVESPKVNLPPSQQPPSEPNLEQIEQIPETTKLPTIETNVELNAKHSTTTTTTATAYLQTQLRMATLEKSFLEQTVEQMKSNHQQELNSMVSLYEQQMRLTSEMYKRHEEMIQEERERRILELNNQLDHTEKEMETMRNKFKERLETVETNWKSDVDRIRDSNSVSKKRMLEEHEQEIARLEQRLKSENDESAQSTSELVQRQSKNIGQLLTKWEQSAYKIEQLQKSVIARQEELARQQSDTDVQDEIFSRKFSDIETHWKSFVTDLAEQRQQLTEVIQTEKNKSQQEMRGKFEETRNQLEMERKQFEEAREQFSLEVNQWRKQETEEAQKSRKEREKLREDVMLFEERRSLLETLYQERTKMLQDEQARLTKQGEQLIERQSELDRQQSELKKTLFQLQSDRQTFENRKQQFNIEKDHLNQLGATLSRRAEELEKLSEVALKEKMDGIQAIDEMDSFRTEIDSKMATIEHRTNQLRKEENRLQIERGQLEQQWMMVRELKESIVCNLCGTALNRAKYPSSSGLANSSAYSIAMFSNQVNNFSNNKEQLPLFHSLLKQNELSQSQNASGMRMDNNDDQNLLFWQLSGQKDAASLAEETSFIQTLTQQQQLMNKFTSAATSKHRTLFN